MTTRLPSSTLRLRLAVSFTLVFGVIHLTLLTAVLLFRYQGLKTNLDVQARQWIEESRDSARSESSGAHSGPDADVSIVALRAARAVILDHILIGVPICLLAAAIAGWALAGRAVAPIEQLRHAARAVSPDRMNVRFHLGNDDDVDVCGAQEELNQALERLEAGFHSLEAYVGNVAHELKTPISILLMEAQILREVGPSSAPSREDYERFRAHVEDEMRRLGALMEAFLTLARAREGGRLVRREEVCVNDVVLEAVRHCDALARQHTIQLVPMLLSPDDVGGEPMLVGDPDLLRTMTDNLIRNAIRFSPRNGRVEVTVGADAPAGTNGSLNVDTAPANSSGSQANGAATTITVRDCGPGIPAQHLDCIFERFVQAPQEGQRDGSGLGLAISKSIVELHGGTIAAHNCDGGGCAFVVHLPRAV